jgi:hypothetical protein
MGYNVIALNGEIRLVKRFGPYTETSDFNIPETQGTPIDWTTTLSVIGEIVNGISLLILTDENTERLVAGTISKNPSDPTVLLFNVDKDTIPTNTLPAVTTIIDPQTTGPGSGLPAPAIGQTYLILSKVGNRDNDPTNEPIAWRNNDGTSLIANANDIIQWDGTRWTIVFDSQTTTEVQYVTNTYTGIQYKWIGAKWIKSWEGLYKEGFWSIVI